MIINARLTTRMAIPIQDFEDEARRKKHEAELLKQLKAAAIETGATLNNIHAETFTTPNQQPEDPSTMYLCAHFIGTNLGEVIGGPHDGVQLEVEPADAYIRIPLDRGVDPERTPNTDVNSRCYKRTGISDVSGSWVYVPSSGPKHKPQTDPDDTPPESRS